jgi:hypothetical protein
MSEFTTAELEAARKAILSTIRKSEKVKETLSQKRPPHASQLALVSQRLKVFQIASSLIARALQEDISNDYSQEDLEEAVRTMPLLIQQIEKVKPKFKEGTSQHTLAVRRIEAFHIASALIERELDS